MNSLLLWHICISSFISWVHAQIFVSFITFFTSKYFLNIHHVDVYEGSKLKDYLRAEWKQSELPFLRTYFGWSGGYQRCLSQGKICLAVRAFMVVCLSHLHQLAKIQLLASLPNSLFSPGGNIYTMEMHKQYRSVCCCCVFFESWLLNNS